MVSLPVAALLISVLLVNTLERRKDEAETRIRQALDFGDSFKISISS